MGFFSFSKATGLGEGKSMKLKPIGKGLVTSVHKNNYLLHDGIDVMWLWLYTIKESAGYSYNAFYLYADKLRYLCWV